jgi:hypothetical protein
MSQGNNMFSDIFPQGMQTSTAYALPPSLPFKPINSARSNRKTIVIVLVVVAVIVLAYLLWRARSRLSPLAAAAAAKMRGGSKSTSHAVDTFQHDIDRISDPETKADMKEWHSFWKIATRPVIKDMLTQVLTVNTQPQAPKQPMMVQTPVVSAPDIPTVEGSSDPNFTAI